MQHVKGKERSRVVVCNSVAQSVIESVRGQHEDFVFVYRRERTKNVDEPPLMAYRAIETMNNTAWQRARREAGLGVGDLHVHDLRHTVGMRLREATVQEGTSGRWNKSLQTLRREQEGLRAKATPPKVPSKEKRPRSVKLLSRCPFLVFLVRLAGIEPRWLACAVSGPHTAPCCKVAPAGRAHAGVTGLCAACPGLRQTCNARVARVAHRLDALEAEAETQLDHGERGLAHQPATGAAQVAGSSRRRTMTLARHGAAMSTENRDLPAPVQG